MRLVITVIVFVVHVCAPAQSTRNDTVIFLCGDKSCRLEVPKIFHPGMLHNYSYWHCNKPGYNLKHFDIAIFDRWGNEMYKSNSEKTIWNGKTPKGNNAADGNYYWIIHIVPGDSCNSTKKLTFKGFSKITDDAEIE